MHKIRHFLVLGGIVLLCGCDKQAKINSQKLDQLAGRMVQLEQSQSNYTALLQSRLLALTPEMDKINGAYYEKNREDALFFHTNTLYLLLTIGKRIEAQLKTADAVRELQNTKVFDYHTNQIQTALLCAAKMEADMDSLEKRVVENINAETRQTSLSVSNALQKQIQRSQMPDPAGIAWRQEMKTAVVQLQRDLMAIKTLMAGTNQPAMR